MRTHSTPYIHLLLSTDGPITTITLNRPDKRNALGMPMLVAVARRAGGLQRVSGEAPGAFCAGAAGVLIAVCLSQPV